MPARSQIVLDARIRDVVEGKLYSGEFHAASVLLSYGNGT